MIMLHKHKPFLKHPQGRLATAWRHKYVTKMCMLSKNSNRKYSLCIPYRCQFFDPFIWGP